MNFFHESNHFTYIPQPTLIFYLEVCQMICVVGRKLITNQLHFFCISVDDDVYASEAMRNTFIGPKV